MIHFSKNLKSRSSRGNETLTWKGSRVVCREGRWSLVTSAATIAFLTLWWFLGSSLPCVRAAEIWEYPLSTMPLAHRIAELNNTNCVTPMLNALQSNNVVKGLVFMPGATDEFYFFRRAKATLTNSAPSLLDAVKALTAQTRIHATFRRPLLLLHTREDSLEPVIKVEDERLRERIKAAPFVEHAVYDDRDWDVIQPILQKALKADVLPAKHSPDSWHFYRHSFAGWNLNGWEAVEAVVLAGKTTCRIQNQGGLALRRRVLFFELDKRVNP